MVTHRSFTLIMIAAVFIAVLFFAGCDSASASPDRELVYDDFDDGSLGTNLGGSAGAMSSSGENDPTIDFTTYSKEGARALSIEYSFSQDNWEGYWSFFNSDESGYDLSGYTDLRMWVWGSSGGEVFKVELADTSGQRSAVYITAAPGFSNGASTSWREMVIPLYDFSRIDMTRIKQVNLVFDQYSGARYPITRYPVGAPPASDYDYPVDQYPKSGTVYIDDVRFTDQCSEERNYGGLIVDDFNDGSSPNNLGGSYGTMDPDPENNTWDEWIVEGYVQDSYEGSMALRLDYFTGWFDSWVGYWSFMQPDESGLDVSDKDSLRFYADYHTIYSGGIDIELVDTSDSKDRLSISDFDSTESGGWSEIVIPLDSFSGVDMTSLKQINLVVDSRYTPVGTILIDLIRFTSGEVDHPPTAVFDDYHTTPWAPSGAAPLVVDFGASESSDSDGVIESYEWDFGDGGTGSGEAVSHVYGVGSYTATLTVTDDDGLTDTVSVPVNAMAENPPVADIDTAPSPASETAPLTVDFDASSSHDSDGVIESYEWDFGDGGTGSGEVVSRTYTEGSYTTALTVVDDDGLTDTTVVPVNALVEDETVLSISPESREVVEGENFTVDVVVTPTTDISTIRFNLIFDSSLLAVENVREGDLFSQYADENYYFMNGFPKNSGGVVLDIHGSVYEGLPSGNFVSIDMVARHVRSGGTSLLDFETVTARDADNYLVDVPTSVIDGAVTVSASLEGDMNGDGCVNVLDMISVGQHFDETGNPHWIREDVNRDGTVNVLDMIMIGQSWSD